MGTAYSALQVYAKKNGWHTRLEFGERDRVTKVSTPKRLIILDIAEQEVEAVAIVDDVDRSAEALMRWMARAA